MLSCHAVTSSTTLTKGQVNESYLILDFELSKVWAEQTSWYFLSSLCRCFIVVMETWLIEASTLFYFCKEKEKQNTN